MTPELAKVGDDSAQGTWREWARHVLLELERLNSLAVALNSALERQKTELQLAISTLQANTMKEIADMKIELATLKVKTGLFWAIVGASVTAVVMAVVQHFIK